MLQYIDAGAPGNPCSRHGTPGPGCMAVVCDARGRPARPVLIGVAFAAHYTLVGMATAAIINALGSLQTATALLPLNARACGTSAAVSS
jgi:hypothetical protein